jgi:hypothetical protein
MMMTMILRLVVSSVLVNDYDAVAVVIGFVSGHFSAVADHLAHIYCVGAEVNMIKYVKSRT